MEETDPTLPDPAPETPWELWYQDTFDRESGLRVEGRGRGLVRGLMELWARHLFETVRPDGGKGFARFHLSWQHRDIAIEGDGQGATRLRAWVYGSKKEAVLENLYGQDWRRGNDDGSAYVVHRFTTDVLRAEDTRARVWLQEDDPAARTWYYHVTKDELFKSVERDTF